VLLLGEAGMGKSTLADAAAVHAAGMAFRVARSWCSAAEMPPYWPWRRLLRELAVDDRFAAGGPSRVDDLERELLFASVVVALDAASGREPLLLVMLLITCRDDPGETAPEVRGHLAELPTCVRRVELAGLDRTAVAELVARITGGGLAPAVVAEVSARTGGNLFFVREVARLLVAQGAVGSPAIPASVREVLERRLARLPQQCHALLATAAVAGDPIDEPLVAAVSGLDEATVVELLDVAARTRLLVHDPTTAARFRFAHALVREVLEDGLPMVERARLHQRVAEELERGGDAETLPHRLAHHWSRATGAGARARTAAWSLRAARAAGLGFEQAVVGFRRALAGPDTDRVAVLLELAEAQRLSGDFPAARATWLEAAALARSAGRAEELALAALGLGGGVAGFEVQLSDERQVELLRQADAALPPGDGVLRAAVRGRPSLALAEIGSLEERVRLAEEAVAMAARAGDGPVEAAPSSAGTPRPAPTWRPPSTGTARLGHPCSPGRWRRPWPSSARQAAAPLGVSRWKGGCAAKAGSGGSNGAAGAGWCPTPRACGTSPRSWRSRAGRCPPSTWLRRPVGRSRPVATSARSWTPPPAGPTGPTWPSWSRRSARRPRMRTWAVPNGCAPSRR
jgi:hypothetical protein